MNDNQQIPASIVIAYFRDIDIHSIVQSGELPMIVIYHGPKDYPDKYAARLWGAGAEGPRATPFVAIADTLDKIRESIPRGMVRWPRDESDDPVVVETWL